MSKIDKEEYQNAWNTDKEKFWKMTYDLADLVMYRFKLRVEHAEEYRAYAVESAFRASKKYDPTKSMAFSYFWKCLQMGLMYRMRLDNNRKQGYMEQQLNEETVAEVVETGNTYIMLDGKIITKEEARKIIEDYKIERKKNRKKRNPNKNTRSNRYGNHQQKG